MPSNCSAIGCSNSSAKLECKIKKISFHHFPLKNIPLLKEWLSRLNRKTFIPNKYSSLCSIHFDEDSLHFDPIQQKRFLKPGALPTKFLYRPSGPRLMTEYNRPKPQMSYTCSAPNCFNNSDDIECIIKNMTFHPFPMENKVLLNFWLIQMDRTDFEPNESSCLCSEHFEQDCFYHLKETGTKVLDKDAVPTKFISEKATARHEPEPIVNNVLVPTTTNTLLLTVTNALEPTISNTPMVLHLNNIKKRKHEESEYNFEKVDHSLTLTSNPESREVPVQTTISGILTELLPQRCTSEKPTAKEAQLERIDKMSALLTENTNLQSELAQLKAQLNKQSFNVEDIREDSIMKPLTGMSLKLFYALSSLFYLEEECVTTSNVSALNQFFVMLIYLKTSITVRFLSLALHVSQPVVSKVIRNVSKFILAKIKSFKIWPSRDQINKRSSPIFLRRYPNCRVILEIVEFRILRPTTAKTQRLTSSSSMKAFTIKGLVGIAPTGGISFISDVWPGSVSDREVFLKSDILDHLEEGDLVIAGENLNVRDKIEEKGCILQSLEFTRDEIAFTPEEQLLYPKETHHAIHYESATHRFNEYELFDGHISGLNYDVINEYFYIVGFLINFGKPLIRIKQI